MQVSPFNAAAATAAELAEFIEVELAARPLDRPDEPAPTPAALLARLTRVPLAGRRYCHWIARPAGGGPVAGVAFLSLHGDQYADLAGFDVTVHPAHRRQGLATALLRAAAGAAADRKCLLIEGLPDGSAGQAWAEHVGFAVVQRTVKLILDLRTADRARWQRPGPAGYRLAQWRGSAPEELLDSYAAARNAIREAPHGELSFSEPEWTAQRVRDDEATAQARDCELRVVAAVHESSGQVAGLTYLEVYRSRPEEAVQQDTAVLSAHRGHGLGVWMKAANLRTLTADHPEIIRVETSNAAGNEHMLRVNEQVGFLPAARTEIREAELTTLVSRLGPSG